MFRYEAGLMLVVVLAMVTPAAQAAEKWYEPFLPGSVDGWIARGPVRSWDRSNIFDYMDGAGELYLAYDFQEIAVRDYSKPSAPKITAEVYLMKSAKDAYGLYSHERGSTIAEVRSIGQDRDYGCGLLRFWKGSYFVRILADRETPDSKSAVIALGKLISSAIHATGERPDILALLPKEKLIPNSVHYFHKQDVLNFHYYLSDANILSLSSSTDAVIAQYQFAQAKPLLLIVRYSSDSDAARACQEFQRVYLKETTLKPTPQVKKIEGGKYVGVSCQGRVLKIVFDAVSKSQCEMLAQPS